MASLPPALAPVLQSLLQARYGPEQREECAGWRGVFEERAGNGALVATRDVEAGETVFLIDHLWCTTLLEARSQLTAHPFIRRNLQVVLGIDEESESESDTDDDNDDDDATDDDTEAPQGGASDNAKGDGSTAMRARLLGFLGIDDDAAATTTEVDLDGIVENPAERPEPAFLSFVIRALPALFPGVEALSLQSLGLGAGWAAEVKATVAALPRLRALWLNGNGVAQALAADAELQGRLEIYNRKLTGAYSDWALRYLAAGGGEGEGEEGPTKLDLAGRGLAALKPEAFAALAPSLRWLDLTRNPRLATHDPDNHSLLPALRALPRLKSLRLDVTTSDEEERLARALPGLRWVNGRYITRVGGDHVLLDDVEEPKEQGQEQGQGQGRQRTRRRQEIVDKVLTGVWARAEPMRLAGPTARHHAELHWCVLDLPGLALGHSDNSPGVPPSNSCGSNMAVLHVRDRALCVTFSAAWPVRRIARGEPVTRDYLEGFPGPLPCDRARLLAHLRGGAAPRLFRGGVTGGDATAVGESAADVEEAQHQPLPAAEAAGPLFPIDGTAAAASSSLPRPLRVFTDMPVLRENLGLPHLFTFSDAAADADIVWTAGASASPPPSQQQQQQQQQRQWRGTLPNLAAVDDKCGMARLLRRGGRPPRWLPQTFCLPEELPALLAYWEGEENETKGEGQGQEEEELWILKPPHLARGWDIALASEPPCVLRHLQASGRLSVSRYLPRPALWSDGHKYDLRFYCLLLSPTQVLIHEHFRVRRAAKPYSLQRRHRQALRRHLTNTTLGLGGAPAGGKDEEEEEEAEAEAGCPTETLHMDAFVAGFGQAHPQGPGWPAVRARVEGMLADCFARLAAAGGPDPYGRALLGVDVLLDGDALEPYLLELNASPNVIGIVRERPAFWDEVFAAAFVRAPDGGVQGAADGAFRPLLLPPLRKHQSYN